MAINVMYQVPAALYGERYRQEARQERLINEARQFQREQAEAARQFQREQSDAARKAAAQNQAAQNATRLEMQRQELKAQRRAQKSRQGYDLAKLNANLQYKQQKDAADRQNALDKIAAEWDRKDASYEAKRESDELMALDNNDLRAYTAGMKSLEEMGKEYKYSEAEKKAITNVDKAMNDLTEKFSSGKITNEEYVRGKIQLHRTRLSIRPTEPKTAEEKMTPDERFKAGIHTVDINGELVPFYTDVDGSKKPFYESEAASKERSSSYSTALNKATDLWKQLMLLPQNLKMSNEEAQELFHKLTEEAFDLTYIGRQMKAIRQRDEAERRRIYLEKEAKQLQREKITKKIDSDIL